jgi:hypothetical protein
MYATPTPSPSLVESVEWYEMWTVWLEGYGLRGSGDLGFGVERLWISEMRGVRRYVSGIV